MESKKGNARKKTIYEKVFKRFFDFVLSLLAIIVLSPVFLIVWICSKISIGGKAIYAQYRPGKNGKVFKLYKFRSMTNAVDEKGNLLPDEKRITKFGKFIRKTSLDELPQLINILKGDMSIVGPRPRLVKDMVFYPKEVFEAYSVRPGLTGPAQVYDRNSELSWESVFIRDLEYANKVTFFKDISLLFKTAWAVVKGIFYKKNSNKNTKSCREYYYADYLLKNEMITQEQYNAGIKKADALINNKEIVIYDENLHKKS